MTAFVTAERLYPSSSAVQYVLKEGDRIIAYFQRSPSVEEEYQSCLKTSKEEFDYRSSGHLSDSWSDDWDQSLSDLRRKQHTEQTQCAEKRKTLLEPYRKAPYIEPEWLIEERRRKEQEMMMSAIRAPENPTKPLNSRGSKPARNSDRKAALLRALDRLTGLASVKRDVKRMISQISIAQQRKRVGLKGAEVSLHMVFYGNPGTGKTTIARLVGKLYFELGVLAKGQFIEVDRSGLVGGYLGETALKVNKVVSSAIGGVLFIDEAYALASDNEKDEYGAEAISTLLKLMEDHRDKLAVIVAGYPLEMNKFLDANPGLRSRFNKYLTFEDYTTDELTSIFRNICTNDDYELTADAENAARAVFQVAHQSKDARFGNGRLARNCFEHAISAQADRLFVNGENDRKALKQIKPEDIPSLETLMPSLLPKSSSTGLSSVDSSPIESGST